MFLELKVISKRAFLALLLVPLFCALLFCVLVMLRGDSYKVDYTVMVGSRYNVINYTLQKDSFFLRLAQETDISYQELRNSIDFALDQRNQAIMIVVKHSSKKTAEKIAKILYEKLTDPALISQESQQKINAILHDRANYEILFNKVKPVDHLDKNLVAQITDLATISAATHAFVLFNNDDYIDDLYLASKLFIDSAVKVNENNMIDQISNSTQSIIQGFSKKYNISYELLKNLYDYYFYNAMMKYADNRLIQLENLQKIQTNLMLGSLSAYQQQISLVKCFVFAYIFIFILCLFGVFARQVMQSSKGD